MLDGWTGLQGVVGLLVAARLVGGVPADDKKPFDRRDLLGALLAGVASLLLCAWWMPRYHLRGFGLTSSDFFQYCDLVLGLRERQATVNLHRGWFGGMVPMLLSARFGVIGGFTLAAALSSGVVGGAMYLWGRALHGRVAGVAMALSMGFFAPIVALARTTNFYPGSVATGAMACAGAALCVRFPTVWSALFCGAGVGLALLMDVRSLYFALTALSVASLGLVIGGPWSLRRPGAALAPLWRLLRLAGLFAPVWVSYRIAQPFAVNGIPGLDFQTYFFVQDALRDLPELAAVVPRPTSDFFWGRSPLSQIPETLRQARAILSTLPPEISELWEVELHRKRQYDPWVTVVGGALILGLFGQLRQPKLLLGLLLLVPYALSVKTAATVLGHPRYYAVGMSGAPVVLGLAWAVAASGRAGLLPKRLRPLAVIGLLLAIVLGIVPSYLSPVARWRVAVQADESPAAMLRGERIDYRLDACSAAHAEDVAAGRTFTWSVP